MKVTRKQNNSHDCIICGMDNDLGLKAQFYEMEDNTVIAKFRFRPEHQSYPGRTHGGIISALLDELIGRAIWITQPDCWGVTMTLNVKFRKPVPYDVELSGIGRIDSETSRTFSGSGEIKDSYGTILAEATAVYMKLPIEKIAGDAPEVDVDVFVEDNITEI